MSLRHSCSACGTVAPAGAKFCAECGARLATGGPGAETRKVATILFCDLAGSTALGESLDPEAFRRVQLRYFETCERVLRGHGGTIEKFIGDAVLCVFGTPIAREDDAVRACRAALDLVAAVEGLNDDLERDWGVRLGVRLGVNTGLVVAGDPSRGQALVSGDPVNTAARLEQAAGTGEVLIGAVTRELLGGQAVCTPVAPLTLKGKAEAVPAWRLIAVDQVAVAIETPTTAAPLVGRHAELEQLDSWLAELDRRPAGGACLVAGAAGVGKSRLLAEAVGRSTRPALWSRCPPYGEGSTYEPLAAWLETLDDEAVERIAGTEASRVLFFATGREEEPATAPEIERAATALAAGLAEEGSAVLVVEDVHWAEPAMLDVLESLASLPRVAVVLSARPEALDARPALAAGAGDLRLRLGPLDHDSATALAQAIVPELAEADRARLVEAAEGSPLVIGQLARHLAEGGRPDALPPGLEAVLQARVENLSPEERSAAERAAVMGREFWDVALAALAPEAPPPAPALTSLTRREFIAAGRADGAPGAAAPTLSRVFSQTAQPYSFTHALLRDAVYRTVPKLRRAELHERLATMLEEREAPDELLAFHLEQAATLRAELRPSAARAVAVKAAKRLERAGERALLRQDPAAARALLTRAAALLDDSAERERIARSIAEVDRATGFELMPGDVFAGYRVLGVAGKGGMGVVYSAEDVALGRRVALKLIAPALAAEPRFRERFARESRIAAHLEHPNVVPVYAAGEEQNQLFIAMRYIEGTDLQAILRDGPLDPARAAEIVAQVADALDAAHMRGLVHRDVKPANVLLTKAGPADQAYLTDFGLTRESTAADGLTRAGQWVGTLAYVAPEQIRAEPVDARADVYALGAVLYQCLTGDLPFPVETELEALAAHLDTPAPAPSAQGAPRAFDRVVARAMSKDPVDRYRSAGDLGRAALAASHGVRPRLAEKVVATGAAAPVDAGRRRARSASRLRTLLVASGVGAVVAVAAVVAAFAAGAFSGSTGPANPAGRIAGSPISVPIEPDHVAAGGGRVWAISSEGGTLVRLDPATGAVQRYPPAVDLGGGSYSGVAIGDGGVWVAHQGNDVANGTQPGSGIDEVNPATGEPLQHVPFPLPSAVAVGGGAVWAVSSDGKDVGRLVRIDPARARIVGTALPMGRDPAGVAVGAGAVWVANRGDDSVWRVDPRTRHVKARVHVGDRPAAIAADPHGVWVVDEGDSTITRIDPASNEVLGAPISLGKQVHDLVLTHDAVWVSAGDGTVTRLDPRSGQVVGSPLTPARAPLALATDGASVWVASAPDHTITRIEEGRR